MSKETPLPTMPLTKKLSSYQVRWFQPDPGTHHTLNCSTLAPARTVARDLKDAGCFTRIGIYATTQKLVE